MTQINSIIDSILSDVDIKYGVIDNEIEYDKYLKSLDINSNYPLLYSVTEIEQLLPSLKNVWMIPSEYINMDIEKYVLSLCSTEIETKRVNEELILYNKLELYNVLKLMVYIVSVFRKNNIVWGVGRGSSVASYCLYLIGIHKVNSIKYELNITDFLKE